jgi:hypothetical protein
VSERCIDTETGNLLHGYELGLLTDDETGRFEEHLLSCEYCFAELKRFEEQSRLLQSPAVVGVERIASEVEAAVDESLGERLKRWLWPETPILYRPALLLVIILLLLYPAYLGLFRQDARLAVRPVAELSLLPTRSSGAEAPVVGAGQPVVIEFVCYDSQPGQPYRVRILDERGEVVYGIDEYRGFDQYETGRLLLGADRLRPGAYRLVVDDFLTKPPRLLHEYAFQIAP